MTNFGKSRKITKDVISSILPNIVNNQLPSAGCDKCDEGYVHTPKEPIGFTAEYCSCLVEAESLKYSKRLFDYSNLGQRVLDLYGIDNWKESKSLSFDKILTIVSSDEINCNWMFLYGTPGSGKTYAAIIGCQIALLQEKSVYFTSVVDLLQDLRPSEEDKGKSERIMGLCKRADVLVLDDIGHEKSSEWVREQLYMIINHRWRNGKCTIFTSNFPIENLQKTVSEAVYSRVKGSSIEFHLVTKKDKRLSA